MYLLPRMESCNVPASYFKQYFEMASKLLIIVVYNETLINIQ
jgi:hypothetical protein